MNIYYKLLVGGQQQVFLRVNGAAVGTIVWLADNFAALRRWPFRPVVASVVRASFRPALAWLLVLCLLRTLLPEAWLVAWHHHQHTTYEPAWHRPHPRAGLPKLWLTEQHQHCHAEQFYDVPFVGSEGVVVPLPAVGPHYPALGAVGQPATMLGSRRAPANRGPPVA